MGAIMCGDAHKIKVGNCVLVKNKNGSSWKNEKTNKTLVKINDKSTNKR